MDKKDNNIDYIEDNEIKKIAMKKVRFNDIYIVAIFLMCLGVLLGYLFIKKIMPNNIIHNNSNNTLSFINNNGYINENITNNSFDKNDKYIITRESLIEIKENAKDNTPVNYNVIYEITENDFPYNLYSSNDSNVLARFSYSYDGVEWKYINNVISYNEETINPLMGKYYDISGLTGVLKVETNHEIKENKIYWRSETIFRSMNKTINNKFAGNFKIELSKK